MRSIGDGFSNSSNPATTTLPRNTTHTFREYISSHLVTSSALQIRVFRQQIDKTKKKQ